MASPLAASLTSIHLGFRVSFGGHPGFSSHVFSTWFHSISNAVEIFCTLLLPDTFKQWYHLLLFKSLLALQGVFVYPSSSQFGGPSWVLHLPRGSLSPSPSTSSSSSLSPVCFSSFLCKFFPGTQAHRSEIQYKWLSVSMLAL